MLHRYHTNPKYLPYPSRHVSIRGIEEEKYSVVDITRISKPGGSATILEEVELSRALFEIYEGAVVRSRIWTLNCALLAADPEAYSSFTKA